MNNLAILNLFGVNESVSRENFVHVLLRETQWAYLLIHQKNDEILGLRDSLRRSLENKELEEIKFSLKSKEMIIGEYSGTFEVTKEHQNHDDEFHRLLLENNFLKQQVKFFVLLSGTFPSRGS